MKNHRQSSSASRLGSHSMSLLLLLLTSLVLYSPSLAQPTSPGQQWCQNHGIGDSFRIVTDEDNQQIAGFVCAIIPSATDPNIADRNPVADVSDLDDLACGFGAHAIGFPVSPFLPQWNNFASLQDVFLYFVGTYVRPYDTGGYDPFAADPLASPVQDPQDCRRCDGVWDPLAANNCTGMELDPPDPNPSAPGTAQYESLQLLIEGIQAGFLVLQPAQPNYDSNRDFCSDPNDDNCAEEVRREALRGNTVEFDSDKIDVDDANSIQNRLAQLIRYLANRGIVLPPMLLQSPQDEWGVSDWGSIRVGGHSGGSGYAYYLARNLESLDSQALNQEILHACLLSGPFDTADSVCISEDCPRNIADWYLDDSTDYPLIRMRAVVSQNDTSVQVFNRTYDLLGFQNGVDLGRIYRDDYCTGPNEGCDPATSDDHLSGHAAIVQEEDLHWARALACFAPIDPAAGYIRAPVLNLSMNLICNQANPPNRADFLAANPIALDPSQGCDDPDGWGCTQCGYWNSLSATEKEDAELCLFDEVAFANAYPAIDPANARAIYEAFGAAQDHAEYCLPSPNTRRSALGF